MLTNSHQLKSCLESAHASFRKGNIAQAELLCREYIDLAPKDPVAFNLLGCIAATIGAYSFAEKYFNKALKADPNFLVAKQNLNKIIVDSGTTCAKAVKKFSNTRKFLLIKAWGFGFWSDVDHVLGQLLLAEITGRIPVIHWGKNSLFRSDKCDNAFDLYFEPVSKYTIYDLENASLTFYPPKWHYNNINEEELNKWAGEYSRMPGLRMLYREEDVIVSDFHTSIFSLMQWLPTKHIYFGLPPEEIYRRLFHKYIRLKPHLLDRIKTFWNERMDGNKWLAVHVRGTDKELEVNNLEQLNMGYHSHIERHLNENPEHYIFLLTDSRPILNDYLQRYGSKIVYTDSIRVDGKTGIHYLDFSRQKVAEEVIQDVWLAAHCDYFLGSGRSNVSTTIQHIKRWSDGTYNLIGDNFLFERNLYLHNW